MAAVTRPRVQRPVTRPRPPVAERVAALGRSPVRAPAALQRRLGNRGTTRLLARVAGESTASITPVMSVAPMMPVTPPMQPMPVAFIPVAPPPQPAPGREPEQSTAMVKGGENGAPAEASAPGLVGGATEAAGPPPAAGPAPSAATPAPIPAPEADRRAAAAGVAAPDEVAPGPEATEAPAVQSLEETVAPAAEAVADRARRQRAHRPAETPVANASAAARQPAVEQQRSSAERTVNAIDAVPPGEVPRQSFKEALRRAIDEATPKPRTEEEADRVMSQGATDASAQLNTQLGVQREQAAGPLRSATETEASPAPEAGEPAPELVPEPTGAAPDAVSPDSVVPAPLTAERLDYSSDRSPTDEAMADAGVNSEQLQRGNEPEFGPALEARSTAEAHEASAGPQYRETEAATRDESRGQAAERLGAGLTGMRAQRLDLVGQVVGEQSSTQTNQSQDRRLVTERVTAIKEATRHDVEVILTAMDATAVAIFEVGLREAEEAYEDAFEEAKGGVGNWLTNWGSDWDELIEESLVTGRAAYLERVGRAIDDVATMVESQLAAAKQRVAQGRAEVDTYLDGLEGSLRTAGEEARQQVSADFDALEASVDERRDRLVERLTQQYRDSYKRMSETEERLREENKSLWQRVYDATVGLIKKIIAFKDLLFEVFAKAASVIMQIIEDPIGFLSNLVEAVAQGVNNFKDHIVEHLEKGLLDWVFGAVARAGIELPATFDLKGILGLVLQILGLTWQNIRRIAVEKVGEPIVHALEMFAEPIIVLINEGPAGLWEWIKEKLTDLKAMLLDEIQRWLITNVIEAGIAWIIGLLSPASAFFKACKAIYDIVMFFVERAQQIADLVKAVTDSVAAIASGSLGAAAKRVEDALARAIPVAIGLLAGLLGLGDLSGTIERFIQRIRNPIEDAIRWLIDKAVMLVKAAGKLLGIGKEEPPPETEEEAGSAVKTAALADVQQELTGLDRVDDVLSVVASIEQRHQPSGLKSLTVEEEGVTGIAVTARASDPQRRTITWDEVLHDSGTAAFQRAQQAFAAGKEPGTSGPAAPTTVALVTVNGKAFGDPLWNVPSGPHAEQRVIDEQWPQAIVAARQRAAAGDHVRIVFAISKTPCGECTGRLLALKAQAASELPAGTEFILAPRSLYEGRYRPHEEGPAASSGTSAAGLGELVEAGWDLRQFSARDDLHPGRRWWDVPLAEYAHKLWESLHSKA